MTNEERIELCLKRLSMGKTSDVVNFSYADALAYIEHLKAENAALRGKLSNSIELPCPFGTKVYAVFNFWDGARMIEGEFIEISTCPVNGDVVVVAVIRCEKEKWDDEEDAYYDLAWRLDEFNKSWWADKEAAHAELEREQKLRLSNCER